MKPDQFIVLAGQCRMMKLPEPVNEYRFAPPRKWRFDAAWPPLKLALEIEGVVYPKAGSGNAFLGGRHVSATGFKADIEKYREAFARGWTILRCLPDDIDNTVVIEALDRRLRGSS